MQTSHDKNAGQGQSHTLNTSLVLSPLGPHSALVHLTLVWKTYGPHVRAAKVRENQQLSSTTSGTADTLRYKTIKLLSRPKNATGVDSSS